MKRVFSVRTVLVVWGVVMLGSAGCRVRPGPLDQTTGQPRTPFQQYDVLRGVDAPPQIQNALGETRPNLRGRLLVDE